MESGGGGIKVLIMRKMENEYPIHNLKQVDGTSRSVNGSGLYSE
jgi:hypothetical protein